MLHLPVPCGTAPVEMRQDASTPERPVEINVWYLRGALDDEVGLIPALQAPCSEIGRAPRPQQDACYTHAMRKLKTTREEP